MTHFFLFFWETTRELEISIKSYFDSYTAGGKAPEVTTKKNNKIHSNIVVI